MKTLIRNLKFVVMAAVAFCAFGAEAYDFPAAEFYVTISPAGTGEAQYDNCDGRGFVKWTNDDHPVNHSEVPEGVYDIKAVPAEGYEFVSWSITCISKVSGGNAYIDNPTSAEALLCGDENDAQADYLVTATFREKSAVVFVEVVPAAADNSTLGGVYTNGIEIVKDGENKYIVETNATVDVVFNTAGVYVFADGTTCKTNTITASSAVNNVAGPVAQELPKVAVVPNEIANTTWTILMDGAVVATQGDPGPWSVYTNSTASIVYTAAPGYYFRDVATVITNGLDTTKDPAEMQGTVPEVTATCAKAVYYSDTQTLSFYYDDVDYSSQGTQYLFIGSEIESGGIIPWLEHAADITSVTFNSSFAGYAPKGTANWFYGCSALEGIKGIANLNTSSVTDMSYMFYGCEELTELNLGKFNTAKVKNMGSMFDSCNALKTIYASDSFTTAAVTSSDDMFNGCDSLEGGAGTTYSSSHVDAEYARIDKAGVPGYFTEVPPPEPILAQPEAVAHTTMAVFTNGAISAETSSGSGEWYAWSNETAYVVYTAESGYLFTNGEPVITNDLDTTVNPAVVTNLPYIAVIKVTKGGIDTYHASLSTAFLEIGEGGTGTATLLHDITRVQDDAVSIPTGSDATLELNGKHIHWTTTVGDALLYFPPDTNGKLTIQDSAGGGGIAAVCDSADPAASALIVFCAGNGGLTVNSGEFVCSNKVGGSAMFFKNGTGDWAFNGGTYRTLCEGDRGADFLFCNAATGKTVIAGVDVEVTVTGSGATGVNGYDLSAERVEINGGKYVINSAGEWNRAFTAGGGTLVVNGGDFSLKGTSKGIACICAQCGGTTIISNCTAYCEAPEDAYAAGSYDTATLIVAGGQFNAKATTGTAASILGWNQSKLTIVGSPVINQPTGSAWPLAVEVFGATLDFSGYTGNNLPSFAAFADGANVPHVTGVITSKFDGAALFSGYYSTRPYDKWAQDGKRPLVNVEAATKADYPWVIGMAAAELVPGSGDFYAALSNAIADASIGEKIALVTNVQESVTFAGKTNELELAGYELKAETGKSAITVPEGAELNLTTGTVTSAGIALSVEGALTVGGKLIVSAAPTNVFLAAGKTMAISTSTPLISGAKIGVTTATKPVAYSPVAITSNGTAEDAQYFTSDDPAYVVRYEGGKVLLDVPDVVIQSPDPMPAHMSFEVLTNGAPVEKTGDKYLVPSNAVAKAVYTTEEGYFFKGGMTSVTNVLDTSKNPVDAQSAMPAVLAPVEYVAPVYKGTDGNPTNGIAYWVTNTLYRYTIVTGGMGSWWEEEGWYVVTNDADVTRSGSVSCHGAINLVLCKGAKLTVTETGHGEAGIATDSEGSFTVYGQPDGAGTLVATGGDEYGAGIGGSGEGDGVNITINGGTVIAKGGQSAAGIGGGNGTSGSNITINGGEVTATGGTKGSAPQAAGIGGGNGGNGENITINGGKVTATGTKGAGIGGGYNGHGSNITLNGGSVMAVGGKFSAGIGGGNGKAGSNIRIVGGKVAVFGYGDPIGSGVGGAAGSGNRISSVAQVFFHIAGTGVPMPADFEGFVIMTPEIQMVDRVLVGGFSGLPGGQPLPAFALTNAVTGATGTIAVDGAKVLFAERLLELPSAGNALTLKAYEYSTINPPTELPNTTAAVYTNDAVVAVGSGLIVTNGTPAYVVYTTVEGYFFADGSTVQTNELDTTVNPAKVAGSLPAVPMLPVKYTYPIYVDGAATNGIERWETNTCYVYTVVTSQTSAATWGMAGATNWFAVTNADVKIEGGVKCSGYVNLILCEGAKLVVTNETASKAGIATDADGSFTIYGQPDGAGELEAFGNYYGAGIGGNQKGVGRNITINGGVVTASGGEFGAGIGGGSESDGSNITLNGGIVTASGGDEGAGIGGGSGGAGKNITINGGTVTVVGVWASGIGGGSGGAGSNIVISDAKVFVCGAGVGIGDMLSFPDCIGNGVMCTDEASGVVIDPSAKVFYNLTGRQDTDGGTSTWWVEQISPMPADFDGFVIMTPETQTVDRVLAAGVAGWTAATTFALTNSATGATGTIEVDGEKVLFAERLLELPSADGKLTLKAYEYSTINPPIELPNTTVKVYTNDAEVAVGSGLLVTNGTPAYVVYEAEDGYIFQDGTMVKTNELDTTVNPAVLGDLPDPVAFIITNQTTLTQALNALTAKPDHTAVWYIGASFTVTKQTPVFYDDAAFDLTILGNGYTLTATKFGFDRSMFDVRSQIGTSSFCVRDLEVVVSNGFRHAFDLMRDTTKSSADALEATLDNVTVTMAHSAAVTNETGAIKPAAAVINNYGKLTLTNGCSFTANTNCYCAIDVTSKPGYDASLTIASDDITFVDNRMTEKIAVEPLVVKCDKEGGTVAITGMEKTQLKWVELANNHGYSYLVEFPWTPVEHTTNKVYAAGKEITGVPYLVPSNASPVYVVYEAEGGYRFDDGSAVRTNLLDTTVSPATSASPAPAVPMIPVEYTYPIYVGGVASNGIERWETNTCYVYTVVTSQTSAATWGAAGTTNWFAVTNADVKIDSGVVCKGFVNLILCEGAKLFVTNKSGSTGIETDMNGSFTVYGQPDGAGELAAIGNAGAGIGGGAYDGKSGKNITINGGVVTATSCGTGAGIGGGGGSAGENITINGGMVTANGGDAGAGIGSCGWGMKGSTNITINGGIVIANGGSFAAGIGGGGSSSDGSYITINGGEVTARGIDCGAGIGGGTGSAGSNISIKGGTVTAIGGKFAASIGGGSGGVGSNITISNAVVFAGAIPGLSKPNPDQASELVIPDVIGNGDNDTTPASNIVIDASAKVFFNLTGFWDGENKVWLEEVAPMPESFDGFVIMTSDTQTNRVLVGGIDNWTAATTFALTNAVTGATGTIEVNGAGAVFAEKLLTLPCADGKLTLMAVEYSMIDPPTEIANTTATVYTNDAEAVVGTGLPVPKDTPAYVVYTADDGFIFEDGTTAKTNQLNTAVNPAVMLGNLPPEPVPLVVAEVICNSVTNEYRTLQAAWEAAQQGTPANPALIRLRRDVKLTNTLETVSRDLIH